MAWESRGNHRYYYHSRRVGRKVVKVYCGRGSDAVAAAGATAITKAQIRLDEAEAAQFKDQGEPLERLADDADQRVGQILEAVLLAGGCHNHHGQWRRRRHGLQDLPKSSGTPVAEIQAASAQAGSEAGG